jgi:serine/threonine protein phosphatase PrpC
VNPSVLLLGRDYPDLGPLAWAGFPGGGGLALSRGANPKVYQHQDPNEDGALLVRVGACVVLAVADGYNGVAASEAALASVRERAAALAAAREESFRSEVSQVIHDVAESVGERRSRTCLIVARVTEEACEYASFGDSALFRAGGLRPQSQDNRLILGQSVDLDAAPLEDWYGHFRPDPGERVAAVTDGVTNFVPDPAQIQALLRGADDDIEAARGIAEIAMRGGAGDNVAVAVFAVSPSV